MLNIPQPIFQAVRGNDAANAIGNGNGTYTAMEAGVNGVSQQALFSMVLNGTLEEHLLGKDGLLQLEGQFDGEAVEGLTQLSDLNLSLDELKDLFPPELLTQFIQEGGHGLAALQQFIEQQTGQSIQLGQDLAANLGQALAILEKQGVDLSRLNTSRLPTYTAQLITDSANGKKLLPGDALHLKELADNQLNSLNNGKNAPLLDDLEAFYMKDEIGTLSAKRGIPLSPSGMILGAEKLQFKNMIEQPRANNARTIHTLNNNAQIITPAGVTTDNGVNSPIIARPVQVAVPVNNPEWGQKFNDQVIWLANQQLKSATIKLNPPELGPIEVKVKMMQDAASVQFNSHNGHIRDLLEQAIPRLREMMGDNGVQLHDVNIADNAAQHQAQGRRHDLLQQNDYASGQTQQMSADNNEQGEEITEQLISQIVTRKPQGLVDYFA